MRNAIITGIGWPFKLAANVLYWTVKRLDAFGWWLESRRKSPPRHRMTFPDPKAQERQPKDDWLPATPFVKQDACPECGSDEFPLTVYDGLRMCPVCKDEAVITDSTFGHTGPIRAVEVSHERGIPGWPVNVC